MSREAFLSVLGFAATVSLGSIACSSQGGAPTAAAAEDILADAAGTSVDASTGGSAEAGASACSAPSIAMCSEGQVAAIAVALNEGEILEAQAALKVVGAPHDGPHPERVPATRRAHERARRHLDAPHPRREHGGGGRGGLRHAPPEGRRGRGCGRGGVRRPGGRRVALTLFLLLRDEDGQGVGLDELTRAGL
jgi:hypothetical protein